MTARAAEPVMSDIIVVRRSGEEHAFYVDSVGFQEVPEFLREQHILEGHTREDHTVEDHGRDSGSPEIREDTVAENVTEKIIRTEKHCTKM